MARISGTGRFDTSHGKITSTVAIPDFYIDRTEVTVAQFKKIGGGAPIGYQARHADDFPATNVGIEDAIGYAERSGKRLPSGVLFEYVASNLGTSKFPWGDDESHTPSWELSPVGSVLFDYLLSEPSVRGLMSNAYEWTCSSPPSKAIHRSDVTIHSDSFAIAHGGPKPIGDKPTNWSGIDVRTSIPLSVFKGNENVGFRCVRSTRPSLEANDFLRPVPK
jgi:formylglycine-generating enzyme required for sulfatase activity